MKTLLTSSMVFFGLLILSACGDADREKQRADYDHWLGKTTRTYQVDTAALDGVWLLYSEGYVYKDRYDQRYHSASGKETDGTGKVMLIAGNRMYMGVVRLSCPKPEARFDAQWLVDLGYNKEKPEESLSKNPELFLNAAQTAVAATEWTEFQQDKQEIKTNLKMRALTDRKPENAPEYRVKITGQAPEILEIAHINDKAEYGVITVFEHWSPLKGDKLFKLLEKSAKLEPCK